MIPASIRNKALRSKNEQLVRQMLGDTQAAAKALALTHRPVTHETVTESDALTVCITNFHRAKHLDRAIESCHKTGVERVAVASMEPDDDVRAVIRKWQGSWLTWHSLDVDLGCNELWLRAAYAASTPRVLILHDDDVLCQTFARRYREIIAPAMSRGCAVTWRAQHVHEYGLTMPTEYFDGPTRELPITELQKFLLQRGKLSLSPIVTVFDRRTLIRSLKEAGHTLPYLHPGMPLGTEIMAYLRQTEHCKSWLYLNEVLSGYGVHEGSGTTRAENANDIKPLTDGYDVARTNWEALHGVGLKVQCEPRILLVSSPFEPADKQTYSRVSNARWTWERHFELGEILDFAVETNRLPRSSKSVGDSGDVPYLRDLLDYGCAHAGDDDIVAYVNLDLALTANAYESITQGIENGKGVCVTWRRTMKFPAQKMLPHCRNGLQDGGVDLIAVTPAWWNQHRNKIPDFFIGATWFDYAFRTYAERVTDGKCYVSDCGMHYPHDELQKKLNGSPRQMHNWKLAVKFFQDIGDQNTANRLQGEKP